MTDLPYLAAMSVAVVGADFDNEDGSSRREEIGLCTAGEGIHLRPEPDNPADPNAVAVHSARGVMIGYVPAERAPRIGQLIREGRTPSVVFQRPSDFGAWIRVAFDGEEPVVTPAMVREPMVTIDAAADAEPEFYPDEVWPDD